LNCSALVQIVNMSALGDIRAWHAIVKETHLLT
jgi:hypothetical protein